MQSTVNTIRINGTKNLNLVSGTDWTCNLSYYVDNTVTDTLSPPAIAYAAHPYKFKDSNATNAYLTAAPKFHVVATEFGTANINSNDVGPTDCTASKYSNRGAVSRAVRYGTGLH